jgi:hypothetical protein
VALSQSTGGEKIEKSEVKKKNPTAVSNAVKSNEIRKRRPVTIKPLKFQSKSDSEYIP